MRKSYLLPVVLAACTLISSCSSQETKKETTTDAPVAGAEPTADLPGIQPVPLPDPGIAGFQFPQDSTTIMGWVAAGNTTAISQHGWGIWTALTSLTTQSYGGARLRVFETWHTKAEVNALMYESAARPAQFKGLEVRPLASIRRTLDRPRQFSRDPKLRALATGHRVSDGADTTVVETVSYSPEAAATLVQQKLFRPDTLQQKLNSGQRAVSGFSARATAIKPVYEIVPASKGGTLYKMKTWTGSPATPPAGGFYQSLWSSCVYVDPLNRVKPNKQQGNPPFSCSGSTPTNTFNINDFIHYKLTAAEAAAFNRLQGDSVAQAGDFAILVAMHIATDEINNWTWQTMWWTPNPDRVPDPSSAAVVAARPAQLTGAPRHYAMSIAYQMVNPAQPPVPKDGIYVGASAYTFNPYLEAPFSSSTFTPYKALLRTKGVVVNNNFGVRTNCMSCHMQASFGSDATDPGYIGDTYVARGMPRFNGRLRTAFLWSIPDVARDNAKRK
ncbi:hypothetical protein Q5H92_08585 [Hymenobacter sp. M29]|uniref:Cytochrome c domain-containing protein n=1 Tax=Hymenobacter mellowenesis TaxID=3063995 RepID=A0ABT9AB45_9BACT|nr:hypothetical protein [Hymenobacter sp. M29]MDO7846410.1 hypothetical protein [Hymenobacter sp. M29]